MRPRTASPRYTDMMHFFVKPDTTRCYSRLTSAGAGSAIYMIFLIDLVFILGENGVFSRLLSCNVALLTNGYSIMLVVRTFTCRRFFLCDATTMEHQLAVHRDLLSWRFVDMHAIRSAWLTRHNLRERDSDKQSTTTHCDRRSLFLRKLLAMLHNYIRNTVKLIYFYTNFLNHSDRKHSTKVLNQNFY